VGLTCVPQGLAQQRRATSDGVEIEQIGTEVVHHRASPGTPDELQCDPTCNDAAFGWWKRPHSSGDLSPHLRRRALDFAEGALACVSLQSVMSDGGVEVILDRRPPRGLGEDTITGKHDGGHLLVVISEVAQIEPRDEVMPSRRSLLGHVGIPSQIDCC